MDGKVLSRTGKRSAGRTLLKPAAKQAGWSERAPMQVADVQVLHMLCA